MYKKKGSVLAYTIAVYTVIILGLAGCARIPQITATELIEAERRSWETGTEFIFQNKTVAITGEVLFVSLEMPVPFVDLGPNPYGGIGIACEFPPSALDKLAKLEKGDWVEIWGTVKAGVFSITVTNCKLGKIITRYTVE